MEAPESAAVDGQVVCLLKPGVLRDATGRRFCRLVARLGCSMSQVRPLHPSNKHSAYFSLSICNMFLQRATGLRFLHPFELSVCWA